MFGAFTDQLAKSLEELMVELRAIRGELTLLRTAIENGQQPHAALRPVGKKAAGSRAK